ncbi:MAG TPA: glycosyltransferase family 2 protein [Niallia sp.]|nr:glycosyltransferase family 2 protein [Niallia sp.]
MLQDSPLISVITPSYNSSKFISNTIESVMNQTYTNWEMIIVDDCSTDHTRELLTAYAQKDERIHVIFLKQNSGAGAARNKALEAATGRFITFLDSDDLWVPEKLETQLQFMLDRNIAFSFTEYELMNEEGERLNKTIHVPEKIDYHGLLKNTIIGCLTVMIDREKTGDFRMMNIKSRQDFVLWLAILKKGFTAYGLQKTLSIYRIVKGSISSNKLNTAKKNWYVFRKIEKLSFPYALWCFIHYAFYAVKKRI